MSENEPSVPVEADAAADAETVAAPLDSTPVEAAPLERANLARRYLRRVRLGTGGMGDVHLFRDSVIGRDIAIKTMRAGADVDADARFVREARVQGQLEHPAIVPVYDVGRDMEGAAYFAMKRVRGLTLEQIVSGLRDADADVVHRYTRRRLLGAFSSVCLAIEFAHSRGVLHRDLKPSNVMLGDFGEVYVLDWGVAKVRGAAESAEHVVSPTRGSAPSLVQADSDPAAKTAAGVAMGTPGYMAPEQVSGDPLDERCDVYALGAVLFELLALEPLHRGATLRELYGASLRGSDARASMRERGAGIPPELDAICVKATAHDPRDRYASARKLQEAVERYLEGDRDLERRRELAEQYAFAAGAAASRARASEPGALAQRSLAMAEVGRAIALDPTNVHALTTLVDLLAEPPRVTPPEAERELAAAARSTQAVFARSGVLAALLAVALVPVFLWLGVRSWVGIGAIVALWGVLAWRRHAVLRDTESDGTLPLDIPLAGFGAAGFTAFLFGPFVLVPAIAAVLAINAMLAGGRSRRPLITTLALASFLVPWALSHLGLAPGGVEAQGGVLVLYPAFVSFPPVATEIALVIMNAGVLLVAATIAARLRRRLREAERRMVLHSWQLRQLVPADLREVAHAMGAPPR
jgi:hypothetical protein